MRSALIAGATGFIGTNLVHALLEAGVTTFGLVRESSPNRARLEGLDGFRPIPLASYDTADLERAIGGVEVDVMYSVLGSGTSHAEDRWEVLLDGNVRAAADVARLAAGRARRLVHVGTCLEYAAKEGPLVESDPVIIRQNWLQAYEFVTDKGALALNDYARSNDPFAKAGRVQVATDVSSV
ncbi:MAG: NAD-dependent epimerase/dehydratase family protein, partial [Chloroflexi bacterium]|nr:NAD-dependent epimerase/dehydratase family protein [Chloroflexota bacterium]